MPILLTFRRKLFAFLETPDNSRHQIFPTVDDVSFPTTFIIDRHQSRSIVKHDPTIRIIRLSDTRLSILLISFEILEKYVHQVGISGRSLGDR